MSKGRILVTGASGFLGWNLLHERWDGWEWVGCSNRNDPELPGLPLIRENLTVPGAIAELLRITRPSHVIHTAAATDLNACETDPEGTQRTNTEVPAELAHQCAKRRIRFLFTSTDMVFDGEHSPYSEQAPPSPINVYGRQKAEAENRVLAAYPSAAVCRMPLMFGAAGPAAHNFLPEWIARLKSGQPVKLFTDEFRAPVAATVAQQGLRMVIERQARGVIHLGGRERMSRYEFGELLCDVGGFDTALLQPVERADLDFAAARPADTFLDSSRAWEWGYASASLEKQLRTVKEEGRIS